jgi:hypothetical protein
LSLDRLLVSSDVVSLHVPLTPETRHLIDKKALARMKRSAYLINTARGPVIDEEALAWALQHHLLAGAALDVYEKEPAIYPDLLELDNVLLAPHIGSATTETRTCDGGPGGRKCAGDPRRQTGNHAGAMNARRSLVSDADARSRHRRAPVARLSRKLPKRARKIRSKF